MGIRVELTQSEHEMLRIVASSQAFSREFPTTAKLNKALAKPSPPPGRKKTDGILTQAEMDWLSHGLKEEIAFIGLAKDKTYGLDIAIYQYEAKPGGNRFHVSGLRHR